MPERARHDPAGMTQRPEPQVQTWQSPPQDPGMSIADVFPAAAAAKERKGRGGGKGREGRRSKWERGPRGRGGERGKGDGHMRWSDTDQELQQAPAQYTPERNAGAGNKPNRTR